MSKSSRTEPTGKRMIYWIEVIERLEGSVDDIKVIQSYPFPDVEFAPFGFDLELFEDQIKKIVDPNTQKATLNRYHFIKDIWHPKNFIRIAIKNWKYP